MAHVDATLLHSTSEKMLLFPIFGVSAISVAVTLAIASPAFVILGNKFSLETVY